MMRQAVVCLLAIKIISKSSSSGSHFNVRMSEAEKMPVIQNYGIAKRIKSVSSSKKHPTVLHFSRCCLVSFHIFRKYKFLRHTLENVVSHYFIGIFLFNSFGCYSFEVNHVCQVVCVDFFTLQNLGRILFLES